MKLPNWQHHSKKEQKRTLKPQALRQAKKRRAGLKKKLLASMLLLGFASPAMAYPRRYYQPLRVYHEEINPGERSNWQAYSSQRGYAHQNKCYRTEYREEYVPGTMNSPGYVKTHKNRVKVPCDNGVYQHDKHHAPNEDNNSCVEGSVLGGILGGGAGAAASRGDGRLWAIPLGIVGGAMVGCQIDGG